jgi:hypothetical protein
MGSDYGRQEVAEVKAGVPFDKWGHALNRDTVKDGEARDLTAPYGLLHYGVGNGDDFHCFDAAIVRFDYGPMIAIHSVINSETGSFIMDGGYEIVDPIVAVGIAQGLVDHAYDWCSDNEVRPRGWGRSNGKAFVSEVKRLVKSLRNKR